MNRSIRKIAIANRGEIAVRLLLAGREMGLQTALLYSSADQDSLAYRLSDEKVCIGPPSPLESYLNVSSIIKGALSVGAEALHPGYGFLSEKAELAEACEQAGLVFIGPSPACLKLFGNKWHARRQAQQCGLPLLPASDPGSDHLKEAQKMGFPVMIKSVHGGGGRGLRIVSSEKQWSMHWASAQREAKSAFGSADLFVEKYLPSARHIEVQVFGDSSGFVHYLFDRDCSVQRNHQKVVESAPAILPVSVRKAMQSSALELMQAVSYQQAGTIEFLYHEGQFYFMEVNPRLQVECPVTEMVLGLDLVKAQIITAQGASAFTAPAFLPRGYSMQCRIYAEDIRRQLPCFGKLGTCFFPHGVGRRFDIGFESGDEISEYYDSMIGKAIVWDENRTRALEKMKQTLSETVIFGVPTNLSFLQDLLSHHDFVHANIHTRFIEDVFLKSWDCVDIHSIDPNVLSQIHSSFSLKQTAKDNSFNPWSYFAK